MSLQAWEIGSYKRTLDRLQTKREMCQNIISSLQSQRDEEIKPFQDRLDEIHQAYFNQRNILGQRRQKMLERHKSEFESLKSQVLDLDDPRLQQLKTRHENELGAIEEGFSRLKQDNDTLSAPHLEKIKQINLKYQIQMSPQLSLLKRHESEMKYYMDRLGVQQWPPAQPLVY